MITLLELLAGLAPQEHTGTGVSPNDELVNMNGLNAPGLGIKLGGCIHSERYYPVYLYDSPKDLCKISDITLQ